MRIHKILLPLAILAGISYVILSPNDSQPNSKKTSQKTVNQIGSIDYGQATGEEETPWYRKKDKEQVRQRQGLAPNKQAMKARAFVSGGAAKPLDMKQRHIAYIRGGEKLDEIEYNDEEGLLVKESLYRVPKSSFPHLMIKEAFAAGGNQPISTYVYVADNILVTSIKNLSSSELQQLAAAHGVRYEKTIEGLNTHKFVVPQLSLREVRKAKQSLVSDPLVKYEDGNSLSYPSAVTPDDQFYPLLWGLNNDGVDRLAERSDYVNDLDSQADLAWEDNTDCSSVVVAVLDTGITPSHPDLKDNVLPNLSRDFTGSPVDYIDIQGHGTHVSGTIGAVGNNKIGVTGVCWKAKMIGVKVLGDDGFGTSAMIMGGLNYALNSEAKVLNMSLGGGGPSQAEQDLYQQFATANKLVAVAAGNDNNDNDAQATYPATYPSEAIISVAALAGYGELAGFSNYGATTVDIAAPGENIASTYPPDLVAPGSQPYEILSGTSMACPHVAGGLALLWSYAPELTAAQVKEELLKSAVSGTYTKAVAGQRIMDIKKFMRTVQADIALEDTGTINAKEQKGGKVRIQYALTKKYADIEKVEIMLGDAVLGTADGSSNGIEIDLPLSFGSASIYARITDSAGRQYDSLDMPIDITIEKLLSFLDIEAMGFAGDSNCSIKHGEGSIKELKLLSVRHCAKLCDIVGPLMFSNKKEISCHADGEAVFRTSVKEEI